MKDDDTESRRAFEKWATSKRTDYFPVYIKRLRTRDGYRSAFIQIAWEAWCAAIKYWDEQINEFSDQPPCSKPKL